MRRTTVHILLLSTSLVIANFTGASATQQGGAISDKEMRFISFEPLRYPAVARSANIQGVVVVRAKLDDHGKVVDAAAISGSDFLIPASVENAKKWQFEPNSQRAIVLVFYFQIEGVCHDNGDPSQFIFHPPNFATVTACGQTAVP